MEEENILLLIARIDALEQRIAQLEQKPVVDNTKYGYKDPFTPGTVLYPPYIATCLTD